MVCYVCGTTFGGELRSCPACASPCLDLSDLSHPGLARLVSPTLSAMYLRGDLATALAMVPRASPPPALVTAPPPPPADAETIEEVSAELERVPVFAELAEATETPIVWSSSTELVLYSGPDGRVDTPQIAIDLENNPADQIFGPSTGSPRYLSLDAEVRRAAFGLDPEPESERNWLQRLNSRLTPTRRPKVPKIRQKADPKAVRMLILTTALVGVTTLFGLQTLDEARPTGAPPTVTLPPPSGPIDVFTPAELAEAFSGQVVEIRGDACGAPTTGPGVLIDDTHVITTRAIGAGDVDPVVVIEGAELPATLLGWGWSPDLAVLELSAPSDVVRASGTFADGDRVAQFGQLTVVSRPGASAAATAVPVAVTGAIDGWAGDRHAVATDLDPATPFGSLVVTGEGQLAGLVAAGPGGAPTVVTGDALTAAIDQLSLYGSGIASCATTAADESRAWTGAVVAGGQTEPGLDAVLDSLYEACTEEGWIACDDLGFVTGAGTTYNVYADSCGGRLEPEDGTCSLRNDLVNGGAPGNYLTGDCVVLARADGAMSRAVPCGQPHDAQIVHLVVAEGLTTDTGDETGSIVFTPEIDQQVATTCAPVFDEWTASRYWDRPLRTGVIRPATAGQPFACFVYQPGAVLTASLP